MARRFQLTGELNIARIRNIKPVVASLKKELAGVKGEINLQIARGSSRRITTLTNNLSRLNAELAKTVTQSKNAANEIGRIANTFTQIGRVSGKVAASVKDAGKAAKDTSKNFKTARTEIEEFGRQSALAVRRFTAFTVGTTAIFGLIRAFQNAVTSAVDFDRELVRVSQVTRTSLTGLRGLTDTITSLSTNLGVSSNELARTSVILSQAGLSARQTKIALDALAKTELAPTFTNIQQTTEGAIALMRQFNISVEELEGSLGSINAVAGAFAVESDDIIQAVRRTGGVFAAASRGITTNTEALRQFVALFTSVRATTRESAESIATGLRTVFTRIQRRSTIDSLRELGVELTDVEGKFVGPFEAVRRLAEALQQLDPRDLRFASIVEELGGFRQIGKVIPLIQQNATAFDALNVAQQGTESLSRDVITAQQALSVQFAKTREEFLALIRSVSNTESFRSFVGIILNTTSSLIRFADTIRPVIPLLAAFGAIKALSAARQFGSGFLSGISNIGGAQSFGQGVAENVAGGARDASKSVALSANTKALTLNTSAITALTNRISTLSLGGFGNPIRRAGGGIVPGTGNRDTVPALLSPGEFVLRKKAVEAIGKDRVAQFNRFQTGGKSKRQQGELFDAGTPVAVRIGGDFGGLFLRPSGNDTSFFGTLPFNKLPKNSKTVIEKQFPGQNIARVTGVGQAFSIGSDGRELFEETAKGILTGGIGELARLLGGGDQGATGLLSGTDIKNKLLRRIGIDSLLGEMFEASIAAFTGSFGGGSRDIFDFTPENFGSDIQTSLLGKMFSPSSGFPPFLDAKITANNDAFNSIVEKAIKQFGGPFAIDDSDAARSSISKQIAQARGKATRALIKKAMGGDISGEDTVPALLTPGEFVINAEAARRIGSPTLNKLNKLQGFNRGGFVGLQNGGFAGDGSIELELGFKNLAKELEALGVAAAEATRIEKEVTRNALKQLEFQNNQNIVRGPGSQSENVNDLSIRQLKTAITTNTSALVRVNSRGEVSAAPQPLSIIRNVGTVDDRERQAAAALGGPGGPGDPSSLSGLRRGRSPLAARLARLRERGGEAQGGVGGIGPLTPEHASILQRTREIDNSTSRLSRVLSRIPKDLDGMRNAVTNTTQSIRESGNRVLAGGRNRLAGFAGGIADRGRRFGGGLRGLGRRLQGNAGVGSLLAAGFIPQLLPDTRTGRIAGGTLQNAVVGSAIGAQFGPAGAAAGAVAGGVSGFLNANTQEAVDKAFQDLQKSTDSLNSAFKNFTEGGSLEAFNRSAIDVDNALKSQLTSIQATRESSLFSDLANQLVNLNAPIIDLASQTGLVNSVEDVRQNLREVGQVFNQSGTLSGLTATIKKLAGSSEDFDNALTEAGKAAQQDLAQNLKDNANIIQQVITERLRSGVGLDRALQDTDIGLLRTFVTQRAASQGRTLFAQSDEDIRRQAFVDLEDIDAATRAQRELNAAYRDNAQLVEQFTSRFQRFGASIDRISNLSDFSNARFQSIFSGQEANPVRENVFSNLAAFSPQEIANAVRDLDVQLGGSGSSDLTAFVNAAKRFEDGIPDLIARVQNAPALEGDSGQEAIFRAGIEELTRGLPEDISASLRSLINNTFANRQGSTSKQLNSLLERGGQELFNQLTSAGKAALEAAQKAAQLRIAAEQNFVNQLNTLAGEASRARQGAIDRRSGRRDRERLVNNLFGGGGPQDSIDEFNARIQDLTRGNIVRGRFQAGAAGIDLDDPFGEFTGARLSRLEQRRGQLEAIAPADRTAEQSAELIALRAAIDSNRKALELLSSDTSRLAAIQEKIAQIQRQREGGQDIISELLGATPDELRRITQENVANARGSLGERLSPEEFVAAQRGQARLRGIQDPEVAANARTEFLRAQLGARGIDAAGVPGVFQPAITRRGETEEEREARDRANRIRRQQDDAADRIDFRDRENINRGFAAAQNQLQGQFVAAQEARRQALLPGQGGSGLDVADAGPGLSGIGGGRARPGQVGLDGVQELSDAAATLSDAFQSSAFIDAVTALSELNIPETIQLEGRHQVEVIINGAGVLQNLEPGIQNLVEVEIERALNARFDATGEQRSDIDL